MNLDGRTDVWGTGRRRRAPDDGSDGEEIEQAGPVRVGWGGGLWLDALYQILILIIQTLRGESGTVDRFPAPPLFVPSEASFFLSDTPRR